MTTAAIAIIVKRERDLVEHFIAQRATSVSSAQSLQSLQVEQDRIFRRLEDRAVIRAGTSGTYYVDEAAWKAMVGSRRRIVAIVLVLSALLIGYIYATKAVNAKTAVPPSTQSTD